MELLTGAVAQAESGDRDVDAAGNVITSPVGAKGRMQVMDATNLDPGYGVTPAADDSLEERARVGRDYLRAMVREYDGDLPKALAAYNAGPGNVNKAISLAQEAGTPDEWAKFLPKPEETVPYIKRVLANLSKHPDVRGQLGPEYTNIVEGLWDRLGNPDGGAGSSSSTPRATLTRVTGHDVAATVENTSSPYLDAVIKAQEAEQTWKDGIDFLDKFKAAYDETLFPLLKRQRDRHFNYVDPGFDSLEEYRKVAHKYPDPDHVEELLSANNKPLFDYIAKDIDRRLENEKVLSSGSLAGTLVASGAAGALDPLTWVSGVSGMRAAALAGKTAYKYYALGGAAGNVGYDALRAAIGADVGTADIIASAALGAGLGMAGYRISGVGEDVALRRNIETARKVAEARAEWMEQAAKELGASATPEKVSARAQELEAEHLWQIMKIALAKPDPDKMIIPEAPTPNMRPVDPELPGPGGRPALPGTGTAVGPEVAQEVLPPEAGALRKFGRRIRDFVVGDNPAPDPDGLDLIPSKELRETVRRFLHHAQDGLKANPIDEARLQILSDSLSNSKVFQGIRDNLGSTAIALLRSESPVARWYAMQALENTTGAYRTSTVAMTKAQLESMYMADVKNEFETLFRAWLQERGLRPSISEFLTNKHWNEFNDLVFKYREGIRNGIRVVDPNESPLIAQASKLLTRQYDMMRRHQIEVRVSGFGSLPDNSEGYQPWAISPKKWLKLSRAKKLAYVRALSEEFQKRHGWDKDFSDYFAKEYVDQVNKWVNGGVHASIIPNESAVEVLKRAMKARNLSEAEARARMDEFTKGGRTQTRGRLDRDMLAPHDDGEGGYFTLSDIMETDAMALLQRQAKRVSGEVAFARHGVTSDSELHLLRKAMEYTGATQKELEAFDQTVAEMLGRPYKDSTPMYIDNLRAATSLVQLGGMVFAQLSEAANAISAFGVVQSIRKVPEFRRLMKEVEALARGEKVDNPLLGGVDEFFGNIGMHNYRNTWAHQMGDPNEVAFGRDSIGVIARLIRGGNYLQAKLSLWRRIHAVQQRGVAEMAVNKGLVYIRDGIESAALRDMGISPELAERIRKDLPNVAEFNERGVLRFEPHRTQDVQAMNEFLAAIRRGVGQIIQETFVGETGKWAHNGWLRLLTQFRTWSITSFEKQFVRQLRTHGAAKAAAILLASISVAVPIHMVRVMLSAALMPAREREEYLEKRLDPWELGMAALGYTAIAGWLRDVIDIGGTALGYDIPGSPRVPRGGVTSSFVPGLSLVEDGFSALAGLAPKMRSDGTFGPPDPDAFLKIVPFGRLPWVVPFLRGLAAG